MRTSLARLVWSAVFSLLLVAPAAASWGDDGLRLQSPATEIGQYQRIDFELAVPWTYRNPFDPHEVDVTLEIRTPDGKLLVLPAFWMQGYERQVLERGGRKDWLYPQGSAGWRARFAPTAVGRYEAVAKLKDANREVRSPAVTFQCVESTNPGFLQASAKDPRFLAFSNGRPMLAIGQNLAFVGPGQFVTLAKAEEIFDKLSSNGANFLRIWTCCEDWAMAIEARKSAWGRSWGGKPPFAPAPDAGGSPGRRCLQLGGDLAANVNLSTPNPLAVRPATRYVLSGKLRTGATDSSVRLSAGSLDFGPPLRAERPERGPASSVSSRPRPSSGSSTRSPCDWTAAARHGWMSCRCAKRAAERNYFGKRRFAIRFADSTIRPIASSWINWSKRPSARGYICSCAWSPATCT